MTIDLTQILQALIGLLATLITAHAIPWIKARTTAQQRAILKTVTDMLVHADEQLYGDGKGAEKLEYVRRQLLARGITVDLALIEAAVHEMKWIYTDIVELVDENKPSDVMEQTM